MRKERREGKRKGREEGGRSECDCTFCHEIVGEVLNGLSMGPQSHDI